MATEDPTSPDGTVPVSQALVMTANWRAYLDASGSDFNVRSYYIPIISLQNLLKYNPDAEGVRVYIGLGDTEDMTSTNLLFTPVIDGKEMPYRQIPGVNYGTGDDPCTTDDCSNIYDLAEPCPPYCAPGGPPSTYLDS